ncbi:MAG TPA: hypothetical protein VF809_00815, partial [Candidatus Saccharimonadales bacterium]
KHAELELILFPGAYQQTAGLWERDRVVLVRGKISAKDREGNIGEEVKIMVDDGREITAEQATAYQPIGKKMRPPGSKKSPAATVTATKPRSSKDKDNKDGSPAAAPVERVYIRLHDSNNQQLLLSLKQCIDETKGPTEVVLVLGPSESKQIIKLPAGITKNDAILAKLKELVGDDNVIVQ